MANWLQKIFGQSSDAQRVSTMGDERIVVCRVETSDGVSNYVTLLSPDIIFSQGLLPQAIVGVLPHPLKPIGPITPDIFARNRVFVDFMHQVIARHAPECPKVQGEARRQGNGSVYIIDQRTKDPRGTVPPQDIIGGWEVKDGEVVLESYQSNPNHMILSSDGFFRLDSNLHQHLLEELVALYSKH
jgi:hypothetical protein